MFNRLKSIVILALAVFAAGCSTTVAPGEVGVEVSFGTVSADVKQPGIYATVFCDVNTMSTRTQTYTMAGAGTEGTSNGSVSVLAKDQLPVALDVSVMFHLNGTRAIDVFRTFGQHYDDTIVHPLVRTAVRDAAAEFTAVDLIDKRTELQAMMERLVRVKLASTLRSRTVSDDAIVIDNILIRNIDLPQSLDDAIANVQRQRQATAAAEQANLTAQQQAARQLTVANGDAAQLLARTRADAEMLRIRSESQAAANRTLSESLTPALLAHERIQATAAVLQSSGTRTVFLPAATAPNMMLNVQ